VLLALLLTAMAAGAWYISERFDALHDLSTPPPEITGDRFGGDKNLTIDTGAARQSVAEADDADRGLADAPGGSTAILLMGVDARAGESIDVDVRADSLAVVFLDGETQSCRMLSIPRDTRADLPGYGQSKINHALMVGGIPYQQLVVENLLGIEIDHYGLIDFAGVTQLVDAVGGITIVNDEAFTIESATTVYPFPVGTLELSGDQALMYARYREGPDGDFGRQERQQQIVRALLSEGASLDVVTAVPDLLSAVEGHFRTDLGPTELVDLGQTFRSGCTAETLETARLEGSVENTWDDLLEMELSFVVVDDAHLRQKVAWLTARERAA
jgi:LCP family protein required for cell wall assembly